MRLRSEDHFQVQKTAVPRLPLMSEGSILHRPHDKIADFTSSKSFYSLIHFTVFGLNWKGFFLFNHNDFSVI